MQLYESIVAAVASASAFECVQGMVDSAMDRLTYALSILAGDPCLQIGQALLLACRDIIFIDAASPEGCQVTDSSLSTWLCDDALFFTLIKSDSRTLVYSHTNKVLYYATPQAQLSPACPDNTALLCQFTVDKLPQESTPRLLAFDILQPRGVDPAERGEALRALAVHMPAPLCCVQWVGPRRYLTQQFVAGLPHSAGKGFALTLDVLRIASVPFSWGGGSKDE